MNSDQWRRVETLYHAALERDLDARLPFLTSTCSDEQVRLEVAALLNYDGQARSFMETSAFKQTAKALAAETDSELPFAQDVGPYRLLAPIGQGGMGQVYLALDTRLNRKVAIKVLPTVLSADPERARRFKQEARAASALSHPNIVTVFEVGKVNERHYIVSEFVEGQTLRELIASNQESGIEPRQAIDIAVQVTRALEAAHTSGVIHRDIKPENVMIRKDGLVKVLDFGLAKINTDNFPETSSQSQQLLTRTGMVMGTAAYMSPEQARGQQIDHRADIFSLGAMLYECLSGKRPFTGETTSDVIAAVLIKDPEPITEVTPHVNQHLAAIVMRCLEKKPEHRFQSAADLAFTLQDLSNLPARTVASKSSVLDNAPLIFKQHPRFWLSAAIGLSVVFAIGLILVALKQLNIGAPGPTVAFNFELPSGWNFRANDAPVVSPDGKTIVFSAFPKTDSDGTQSALWIHNVETRESKRVQNTEDALAPFWSPDSHYVAFFQGNKLNRLEVANLNVITLADLAWTGNRPAGSAIHGSWGSNNVALISAGWKLFQFSIESGTLSPLEPPIKTENGRANPNFLPDGNRYLYFSRNNEKEENGIYVAALDSNERKLIVNNATAARYASGYLLFTRERQLFAQQFDLAGQRLTGQPVILPAQVGTAQIGAAPVFSASDSGVVAWRPQEGNEPPPSPGQFNAQLTWFDTAGHRLGTVGTPGNYTGPALSPNQQRVVVAKVDQRTRNRDLWIIDVTSGASRQFTNDASDEFNPVWAPDGNWIYFSAARNGTRTVFRKRVEGSDEAEQLMNVRDEDNVEDISPDGKFLLINTRTSQDVPDLALITLNGPPRRIKLTETSYREDQAAFSPNGKWIAYHAEAPNGSGILIMGIRPDGRPETNRFHVTTGGMQPRWNADGNKLFYMDGDKIMSVDVTIADGKVAGGGTAQLFPVKVEQNGRRNRYLISRDGKILVVSETEVLYGNVIAGQHNWTTALQN